MKIETTSLVSFSPMGSLMALGTKAKILNSDFSSNSLLQVRSLDTDEVVFSKVVPTRFNRLKWGMYGNKMFLAGGLDAGNVTLWDATGMLDEERQDPIELIFKNHVKTDDDILGIDFAGAMPVLTTGSYSGKIMMWNLRTLDKPLSPGVNTKFEGISCLQWNQNMTQILAVGTTDGMVSILDLRGKSEVTRIGDPYFSKSEITSLEWDPNSNSAQLAVSSSLQSSVMLYDLRISRGTPRLEGHTEGVLNCKWSRQDPSLIITCGRDNSVIAWDANTYKKRGVVVEDSVFDFAFSPDNPDLIAYSSYNGHVVVDTLTSLNARSPFLGKLPEWQKQGPGLCFTSSGLLVSEEKGPRLRKWTEDADKTLYEWKVLDAYEKEHPRREILKILKSADEKSPILESPEGEEEPADIQIDEKDAITEMLIRGDFSSAFSLALKENAHLAALIAMCDGEGVLKREKERILKAPGATSSFLLVLSILSGDYSGLIKNNVDWKVIVKILGSHCTDEEFIPKVRSVAECLEKTNPESAKICYLIAKDVQKYQEIEEKQTELPKTIYSSVEFMDRFKKVFSILERATLLMKKTISIDVHTIEYLKILMRKGEKKRVLAFVKSLDQKSASEVEAELNLPSSTSTHQSMNRMNIHGRTQGQPLSGSSERPLMPQSAFPRGGMGMPGAGIEKSAPVKGPGAGMAFNPAAVSASLNPLAGVGMAQPSSYRQNASMLGNPARPPMGHPGAAATPNAVSTMATPSIGGRAGPKISYANPQMGTPFSRMPAQAADAGRGMYVPPSGGQAPFAQRMEMPGTGPSLGNPSPFPSGLSSSAGQSTMSTPFPGAPRSEKPLQMPQIPMGMPAARPPTMASMQSGAPSGMSTPGISHISSQGSAGASVFRPGGMPLSGLGAGASTAAGTPLGGMRAGPSMQNSTPFPGPMGAPRMGTPFSGNPGMRMNEHSGHMGGGMHAPQMAQEVTVTPEMAKVYADMSSVVSTLLDIINNKKGALKGWLLKSIDPKLVVLRKHLSERKWAPEFVSRMGTFVQKVKGLGIDGGQVPHVGPDQLNEIRREGDLIAASRPQGTEIEIWMPAIYSLLKVALH
ncbi:protein transport protein SEC31 [Nematocida major]|uniref:protein transport protein SEC31 n=1 Tax=Nematocida major TaxID=1912982 RepID=UPI002008E851|nr:protein transport protein SEC31 [Nematocida major]KAH9386737.1 protein transport protein SEC31 [Nematocida major]